MNKVILMGRLTNDPDVRYAQGENSYAIARFSLAVNRKVKSKDTEADFFNCTAFGKTAEVIEKYLKKGSRILVAGRLQNNNYTNKEGQKVYGVQVLVEEMEFAESKSSGKASEDTLTDENGFMNIPNGLEEELPFN